MIDRVNLYTYTTIKGPGTRSGSYTYLLEYITDKGPATLTKQGILENVTEHQAHMRVFREGMERLKKSCEVMVYTDSRYLRQGVEEWLKRWQAAVSGSAATSFIGQNEAESPDNAFGTDDGVGMQ